MPHVDVHHRVYLGAGHHRQPRNGQPWVEPYGASGFDAVTGTPINEVAFDSISFTPPMSMTTVTANFAFWSRGSATSGATQTSKTFSEIAGTENLTLIAWYFLPASGGPGNGGGTSEIIDAYSVALGDFINDDFVTVTSDPSLTSPANVDGVVPTTVAETVVAFASVASTGEQFDQWVLSPDGCTATGETLSIPAGANLFAFATYDHRPAKIGKPNVPQGEAGVVILDGIINDAPGHILVDGHPVPVDPGWGSLLKQVFTLLGVAHTAGSLSREGAERLRGAAAQEIGNVAQNLGRLAKRGFGAKE